MIKPLARTLALTTLLAAPAVVHAAPGYVIAKSHYGNGYARAPIRVAQFGLQVRLPGGPWIYCETNSFRLSRAGPCSETLRRESLDFWETRDEEGNSQD